MEKSNMKRFNIKIGHFDKGYKEDHRSDGEYVKYADIKGMILVEEPSNIPGISKAEFEAMKKEEEKIDKRQIPEPMINEQQRREFEVASRPLMEWLSKNCHPHVKVIVDYSRSEMLEVIVNFPTEDYI